MKINFYFGQLQFIIDAEFFHGFISDRMKPFTYKLPDTIYEEQIEYKFTLGNIIEPSCLTEKIWQDENISVYRGNDCEYRVYQFYGETDAYAIMADNFKNKICGFILPGQEKRLQSTFHFQPMLMLDSIFIRNHAFVLHASFIRYHKKGLLFFGPSGAGKTTQAKLWEKYRDAEIINGDRALIQKCREEYYAFGIPWCGSSDICKNQKAPVSHLVKLKIGNRNRVRRLNGVEACRELMQESAISPWNIRDKNLLLAFIVDLAGRIPVLELTCRPEEEAVTELEKYVKER